MEGSDKSLDSTKFPPGGAFVSCACNDINMQCGATANDVVFAHRRGLANSNILPHLVVFSRENRGGKKTRKES